MSSSLRLHGLQLTRLPCPSPTPELTETQVHQVSDATQPSHPLSSPSPPAFSLSQNQGKILWVSFPVSQFFTKYWSFSISPSDEYSGLISFRIDWLDLLAVQGTLKSHRQHHSSKVSILWHSAFFILQLSHSYTTTGKNHSFDYMDSCQQSDVSAF